MNFDLSDEQELLQDTVRQFAANECPPPRVRAIFDGEDGHDTALWKGLVELGLGAVAVPDEFGGAGLELLDQALVAEVLGAAALPGPFLGHSLAGLAILWGGSDAQKKTWLPKLASGERVGTVAFAEGDARWQPEEWTLAGGPTLSGVKSALPFGAHADLLVVGTAGGGLALVERGARGLAVQAQPGVDRTRRIAEARFDATPAEPLPNGVGASARVRDAGLVLLAADAFGGAQKLLEMSVEYAKTRQQFGVTIGSFQGLKHQLANMAVEVEPARGLYWYAAHAFDRVPAESARSAALAKAHLTQVFMQAARDSVEAHGGIGFTWECDVQIYFKRAMFDRAFLGTPSVHRERAAALAGW
ncbi:MAG TPA: acyl-CoA dehydrogenase family protein [Myxococcota bacterium]|nr:acyl-CoA dehydrogenase family protein [Myxococcota bacterium]